VANESVLLAHERAFVDQAAVIAALGRFFGECPFHYLPVSEAELPLADAVSSYLFNSQLVNLGGGRMLLVVPAEARENVRARAVLERLLADDNPIAEIVEFDLRQSMRNGGGPACLRLRVVLDDDQRAALGGRVVLDEPLHRDLDAWIRRHYRDRLSPDDLGDPDLADECRTALDELTRILELGCLYPFQRST
jgi:succinylarginine dihydrolase